MRDQHKVFFFGPITRIVPARESEQPFVKAAFARNFFSFLNFLHVDGRTLMDTLRNIHREVPNHVLSMNILAIFEILLLCSAFH